MGFQQVKNLVDHALARVKDVRAYSKTASQTVTIELLDLLAAGLEYNAQAVERLNAEVLYPRTKEDEGTSEYVDRVRKFLGFGPLGGSDQPAAPAICGVISNSGRVGEPLACAKAPGHKSPHAWATLPTFDDSGESEADRLARHRGEEIARLTAETKRIQREVERLRREAGEMNFRCGKMTDFFNLLREIAEADDNRELAKTVPGPYTPS